MQDSEAEAPQSKGETKDPELPAPARTMRSCSSSSISSSSAAFFFARLAFFGAGLQQAELRGERG